MTQPIWRGALASAACGLAALPPLAAAPSAVAQTDEIQVYDAQIAAPGTFNLTLHDNYTPQGRTTPDFAGGVISNHSLNGVPEWAYGVTDWMEAGLYFPLYTLRGNGDFQLDGLKLRALFVLPDAGKRTFFYGVNFEFSVNSKQWEADQFGGEIRPIVGWRVGRVDLIFNPIFDTTFKGVSRLDFAPETRIAYNLSPAWAVAAEEYDDFGPVRGVYGFQETHQLFGVVDFKGKPLDVEVGVGVGLNHATDGLTLKLILSRDL
jgi:hypothetical protein